MTVSGSVANRYKTVFPYGFYIGTSDTAVIRDPGNATTTTSYSASSGAAVDQAIYHPEVGSKALGFDTIMWAGQHPFQQETVVGFSNKIEAATRGGTLNQFCGPYLTPTASSADGWDSTSWFGVTYDPAVHTAANADIMAARYAPIYASHPSAMAFCIRDDVASTGGAAAEYREAAIACAAMQRADGRPCAAVWVDKTAYNQMGSELKLITTYRYPCGQYSNGTPTAEGDFHKSTFSSLFAGADWVDMYRDFVSLKPDDVPLWYIAQAHQTTSGPTGTLNRYPTPREMRKQVWCAVGEGVKGIFWFTWNDQSGQWNGLANPVSADRLAVIAEMGGRLKPAIRRALLRCNRVADKFTTSGGGTTGLPVNYSSAYVSTLYDATRDEYYCVLCNHSTSTATVTVNSATLTGTLTNMETGASFRIGGTVSLPALDGGIWKYDPAIGVPVWNIDYDIDVETWWTRHWANPASSSYIAPASIKTWPNEVIVTPGPGNLQAAINAAPDYTTFRIQAGTYDEWVRFVGRKHLHFVAFDPNNKPVLRGFEVIGSTYFEHYNGSYPPTLGAQYWLFALSGPVSADAVDKHRNPAPDFVFRDLIFDGTGYVCDENYRAMFSTATPTGYWAVDHISEHTPIFCRNVRDVLVQNCTFQNVTWGDDPYPNDVGLPTYPNPVTPSSASGIPGKWHPGMVSGNSGITNVVVRGCTFTGSATSRGTISAVFFDGARGVVVYGNTMTGKYHGNEVLFLTNDDYTGDTGTDGRFQEDHDIRNARYCVVVGNTLSREANPIVGYTGRSLLVRDNTIALGGSAMGPLVKIFARCARYWYRGMVYYNWDNVIRNNTITGTGAIADFVVLSPDGGDACSGTVPSPNPWRGRLGRTTVRDNVGPTGGVTNWLTTVHESGLTTTVDGPDTVTGNSPATGATYTWTDLGQDSVLFSESWTRARAIRDVVVWQNRVWLMSGDIDNNAAPTFLRYYDLANGTFNTIAGGLGGEDTEAILGGAVIQNKLVIPYNDPASYSAIWAWVDPATMTIQRGPNTIADVLVHGFMLMEYNGALLYAGAGGPLATVQWEATVFRSTDWGATWTKVHQPQVTNAHWYLCIFQQAGFAWVVGYDAAIAEVGPAYKSADGITWTSAGFDISPNTTAPIRAVNFNGKAYVQCGYPGPYEGYLIEFDGTGTGIDRGATALGSAFIRDLCVAADGMYLIYDSTKIYRTTDGTTYTQVATTPVAVRSIDIDPATGTIYCGTDDSHLYRGVPS